MRVRSCSKKNASSSEDRRETLDFVALLVSILGEELLVKEGRKLALTEMGRTVYRYAEEIFTVGRELMEAVKGRAKGQPLRLNVGVADSVSKMVVRRLLQPALELAAPVRLVCHEDAHENLLVRLASHELDLVIADAPVSPGSRVRAFSHLLGETSVSLFGTKDLARTYRRGFPKSLDNAPMLLPLENLTLRRSLDEWFSHLDIKPRVVAEFEDDALLRGRLKSPMANHKIGTVWFGKPWKANAPSPSGRG